MVLAHRFLMQSLSQLVTVARRVAGCIERVGCFLGRFSGLLLRIASQGCADASPSESELLDVFPCR